MHIEILALRHQLAVLQRRTNKRPSLRTADRLLWVMLVRFWTLWRSALVIVKPHLSALLFQRQYNRNPFAATQLLFHRHKLVKLRTMVANTLP